MFALSCSFPSPYVKTRLFIAVRKYVNEAGRIIVMFNYAYKRVYIRNEKDQAEIVKTK